MTRSTTLAALRYALFATGVIFIFGIATLVRFWPAGWNWGQSHYLPMILGVYATLGVFLLLASRDPLSNRSLIWFTVWSSVVHAVVMAVMAFQDPAARGHLLGDVPALLVVAGALAFLTRRAASMTEVANLEGRRVA